MGKPEGRPPHGFVERSPFSSKAPEVLGDVLPSVGPLEEEFVHVTEQLGHDRTAAVAGLLEEREGLGVVVEGTRIEKRLGEDPSQMAAHPRLQAPRPLFRCRRQGRFKTRSSGARRTAG